MNDKVVSFDDEKLILVDEEDNVLGYESKVDCHRGDGILHRAFSIFIFNDDMELILQKRSDQKPLWPLYWSNTCCSHPRKGENMETAVHRRLLEEIGFDTRLIYLYKFQYQAKFKNVGSENELCSVYIGRSGNHVQVNENEIADWRYITIPALTAEIEKNPRNFTPWFKMEWEQLTSVYISQIQAL